MDRRYSAIIRGVTGGGAKSGNEERGPGEWAYPNLLQPEECVLRNGRG